MFERISRDDKMLLAFATQEAGDLGHRQLGNDHLILGMLCNARSPLFALLADQGLTLTSAREVVRKYHGEHAERSDTAETADDESARERYEEDRKALRGIGIDLDKVREAVRGRFGEDLSDGWGERAERGPRARGHGRRGHRHHGRGRGPRPDCGPQGLGPEGFGPGGYGPGGPFGGEGPWEPGRGRRGPRGRGARPRFANDTRTVFGRAMEIARERGDRRLRAEYLLLGIIDTADDASRALIESATTADELRAAVVASLPDVEAQV
ncbi:MULTISPECIES: Clp protease N-terminal domain-containing protein [unclassified Gordonia (in: high G+C Gram-positive bacteria)]|uniref:Clp protease N-terminal domain-containing protein n=1 Tax=unclassified Gordonia (in: high G+C Gram-positive bacteria) TaxID=2657482 RepID=UPI00196660F0|nr:MULTISPECIES: Clp protease N-terminal domain-containing protein [unclassified Gordonia (in: high G+C Gram-positive bacteria)]MBN0972762.1 ATP-dependent Clp protease ATP-binding subunit [Gordonia sp. BP-119]MBN0982934.1 ATP-dependent Clp protease ATP-binding subunit [Gordonia sp. BP-94]